MTLVIPPGFAQVAWRWTLAGDPEPMITTCGMDVSAFGGDYTAAAEAYTGAWITAMGAASMHTSWTYIGVRLQIGQDAGPPVIAESIGSVAGTSSVAPLPQNCSLLVRKGTSRGGRMGRGRMFLPPFAAQEGGVDSAGVLGDSLRASLQDNVDDWFGGLAPFLLHDDGSPGSTDPDAVTSFIVDRRIATQRRRLR